MQDQIVKVWHKYRRFKHHKNMENFDLYGVIFLLDINLGLFHKTFSKIKLEINEFFFKKSRI